MVDLAGKRLFFPLPKDGKGPSSRRGSRAGQRGHWSITPCPEVLLTDCAVVPAPVSSPAETCSQGTGSEKYPPPHTPPPQSFLCHMKEKPAAC